MKKYILTCLIILGIAGTASASWYNPFSWFQEEVILGALPYFTQTGSVIPGSDTVNNNIGTTSPSNLRYNGFFKNLQIDGTCTGCGSGDWNKQTNYGVLNLTASTTIPYWAKDAFYASSTSVFQGLATFGNASTSQISATNSYLGTVLSGTWNGTALGNAYVDDDITLTNITQITNRAITDLTGTLTVANGGTGQTSFTSSQLIYGNGTAALSSIATTTPTLTAPLTYSGTLGSFVGGVAGTFDCTSATGSVKGCLTSTDWTTFNSKQATISATWPITLSGAAVGFNGLSTSTAAVVGNIPYFSGVNTFANVATTSLTGTAPMVFSNPISVIGGSASVLTCTAASGSVAGCLSSTDWTTFNNKADLGSAMTGTFDSNNFAGGAIGAGELIYGGSAGSFSELALGTNGYVLALAGGIPAWVATTTLSTISGTLDISAQSNLTCGTNCTLTGDDISVDDAFIQNSGDVGTGAYDFGGASAFEVPNGASPTVDATGELAVDTTSDQLVFYGASEKKQIVPFYTTGFSYATSSSWVGTTTIFMAPAMAAITVNSVYCESPTGTLGVSLYDGTNRADYIPTASSTINLFSYSTNNTWIAGESIRVDIGTPVSSPNKIACRFKHIYTAD